MRIVINAFSARRGGGQTYIINLLQNLAPRPDLEVFVLASKSLPMPKQVSGIHLLATFWPNNNPLLRPFWERLRLPGLLKKLQADILFCPGGLVTTRVPKSCKIVTMFRNMTPFDPVQRAKYPFGYMRLRNCILEKGLLSSMLRADLVIFISQFARRVIERKAPGRIKKAVVIPHGLSAHFKVKKELLSRPQWLPKEDYLLYVSVLDVYKNQLEVVRSYALLKKIRSTKEKLVLVGYHQTRYGRKVIREIAALGLTDEVIVTGPKPYEELPAIYAYAKINIFASECENCPNILLEAFGAGQPLIVSNKPPMPEFGQQGVLYFDPASPQDLAEKISSIIDDDKSLQELAQKAVKQAQQYNWVKTAQKTWEAIFSLANKDRAEK